LFGTLRGLYSPAGDALTFAYVDIIEDAKHPEASLEPVDGPAITTVDQRYQEVLFYACGAKATTGTFWYIVPGTSITTVKELLFLLGPAPYFVGRGSLNVKWASGLKEFGTLIEGWPTPYAAPVGAVTVHRMEDD